MKKNLKKLKIANILTQAFYLMKNSDSLNIIALRFHMWLIRVR